MSMSVPTTLSQAQMKSSTLSARSSPMLKRDSQSNNLEHTFTDDTHSAVLSPHGAVLLLSLVCEALLITQVHVILELTGQPVIFLTLGHKMSLDVSPVY